MYLYFLPYRVCETFELLPSRGDQGFQDDLTDPDDGEV